MRQVQERCDRLKAQGGHQLAFLDGDTAICADSFDAALHAAGWLTHWEVSHVKFLIARLRLSSGRPGHVGESPKCLLPHPSAWSSCWSERTLRVLLMNCCLALYYIVGPRGVVRLPPSSGSEAEGPDSHGFCLLNNISIGAAYALNVHRDKVRRTAIVDFGQVISCNLCNLANRLSAPFRRSSRQRHRGDDSLVATVRGVRYGDLTEGAALSALPLGPLNRCLLCAGLQHGVLRAGARAALQAVVRR